MAVDLCTITQQLNSLSSHKQKEILVLLDELSDARSRIDAQDEFLPFVRKMWPAFIEGSHHKIMADAFNRIAEGSIGRSSRLPIPQSWQSGSDVRFVTSWDPMVIKKYFRTYP